MSITKLYALSPCPVQCMAGSAPGVLTATSQPILSVNGQLVLTKMDTTVTPFGTCNILTAAASGVPVPCAPVLIPKTWTGTSDPETINSMKILLKTSSIMCGIGGKISITG